MSGHASNVGIVGWSVGGGHGQLVPMLGMGVDQVSNDMNHLQKLLWCQR